MKSKTLHPSEGAVYNPPILVKFASNYDKEDFHHRYFVKGDLNLTNIGFSVDQRIIIVENLTKHNQAIFAAAIKLKKEKTIFAVSTSHGVVYIKKNEGDRPVQIKFLSELERLETTT
jgi:hypothetical protein